MDPIRAPLAVQSSSRDASRTKGSWGINSFNEGPRFFKRAGVGSKVTGTSPGQGLFNFSGSTVSIQNDVLHVGASTFAL